MWSDIVIACLYKLTNKCIDEGERWGFTFKAKEELLSLLNHLIPRSTALHTFWSTAADRASDNSFWYQLEFKPQSSGFLIHLTAI